MVRDVRFITLNSSYRELQEMLVTSYLKTLALVESRGERGTLLENMSSLSLLLDCSSPVGSNINSIVKSFIISDSLTAVELRLFCKQIIIPMFFFGCSFPDTLWQIVCFDWRKSDPRHFWFQFD